MSEIGMSEWEKICDWLADFSPDKEANEIADCAMSRCQVSKGRRPHVRECILEAFKIIAERQQ